ncbi:MAG: dihydrolipoyllysine-residue acetyltransferase [Burkholderiales bacterium]|nr:dihydrolipoyllysine-residue acetyltransferase [Burkholderiales bacterium]
MSDLIDVSVPDIGDFSEVEVIEVLVKVGDEVQVDQSLVTVESDKASMEIPSSSAGVVAELKVKLGDKVSKGSPLVVLKAGAGAAAGAPATAGGQAGSSPAAAPAAASSAAPASASAATAPADARPAPAPAQASPSPARADAPSPAAATAPAPARSAPVIDPDSPNGEQHIVKPHASPSVRKFARELGVDLSQVRGTGPKQRIVQDDVRDYVKNAVRQAVSGGAPAAAAAGADGGAALGLLPWPKVDFTKFGPIESRPQPRIRKISAANLHRNWVMIPHVTNHEDADITELEAFRVQLNRENEKSGVKVTLLAFLVKACVAALKKFPDFNSSLDGENLILKRYYHIGFAADTPNGLMVPVIRDADQKGVLQIARETAELAAKAREGKLAPGDMQGGTFSISSLGGIGGTYFTPIINAPEVAILGVCRSAMRPTWDGKAFQPRLILPMSLSWDHRVVDGAAAGRFNTYLAQLLADFRRTML